MTRTPYIPSDIALSTAGGGGAEDKNKSGSNVASYL
jgi:hypothetical protein